MAPQEPDERSRLTSRLRPEECCGRLTGALGGPPSVTHGVVSLLDNPTCSPLPGVTCRIRNANRGSLAGTNTSEREIPSRPEIGRTSDISPCSACMGARTDPG